MSESITPAPRYGALARGIGARDVELAADALLRAGERPTIEKIRDKIGRGSPNTINPLLDAWWKRLGARLEAGPAALQRLPESVLHVAEALWMQALEEGRRRATLELAREARGAARTQDDLEIRSHVLTLREAELDERLRERERNQASLETRLHELTLLLRKEQATREAQARRIASLEEELGRATKIPVRGPRTARPPKRRQNLKPRAPAKRALPAKRGRTPSRNRGAR